MDGQVGMLPRTQCSDWWTIWYKQQPSVICCRIDVLSANLLWEHCRYWLEQIDRSKKMECFVSWVRQTDRLWSLSAMSTVKAVLSIERCPAGEECLKGPSLVRLQRAWITRFVLLSLILSLLLTRALVEIEMVTWFMSKWKRRISGAGPGLWGAFSEARDFTDCVETVFYAVWLSLCLTASVTDWDCVPLRLTLQQCLISSS